MMLPIPGIPLRMFGNGVGIKGLWIGMVLLLAGVSASPAWAQSAAVRGFVTAEADGEALQGVNVSLDDLDGSLYGAVTDRDGFFLIARVPPGRYALRASFIGFATYVDTLEIEPGSRLLVNIALNDAEVELDEVAIEAERESGAARVTAGMQSVEASDIELIPAPDVSGDLVSYLSTMPGVVLMGDRGGQVFVRGGEPSHNLTLIDGIEVYQPFHVLGFYSAFPSEIISQADVYAGGFGSKFTGRLSSVIDVQMRNGNKQAFSASGSVSPFTSSGRLEGPLVRGRASFLGTARVSTLDQLASQYVDAPLPYAFSDMFGKVHALLGTNQQLSITALHTYDRGTLSNEDDFFQRDDEIRWRNTAAGVRYLLAPRSLAVLGEVLVSYSRLLSEFGPAGAPTRTSRIETVTTAVNMINYGAHSEVYWGFYLRAPLLDTELGGLFQNVVGDRDISSNAGAYLEPDIHLGRGWHVRPSLSIQAYGIIGGLFEPRLRVLWNRGIHHWSAAAGIYRQPVVGFNDRRDAANIFTAWVETPADEAAKATHVLLGYRVEPTRWLELSTEGYYKWLDHIFMNEWTAFPRFSTTLQEGHGWTGGFDVRLEVRRPRFYGFINYGYSSTRYEIDPDNPVTVNPGPFRPPHDRRHQVNLLATTVLFGFDLSVRWQFGSGLPYTQIEGFDGFILMNGAVDVENVRGFPRVIYDSIPYRAELPAYHRLDITVDRTFTLFQRADLTAQVGVLNVYDRANLFSLDLFTAQRTDQLPLVPIVGLKVDV